MRWWLEVEVLQILVVLVGRRTAGGGVDSEVLVDCCVVVVVRWRY